MQISGITKFSLLDYPGKISCIVFTPGCNLRCSYCHNSEFVLPEKLKSIKKHMIPEKVFFQFLEQRTGLLEAISICGGEPTLQKKLPEFCRKCREMGFLVKLDTNGCSPKIISELLSKKLVDYIAMDIKNPLKKMKEIVGVPVDVGDYVESIDILLSANIDYEFRTTVIKGVHSDQDMEKIVQSISGAKNYYIQNYRPGNTLKQNFIGESFLESELDDFKNIAEKYVESVGIRS